MMESRIILIIMLDKIKRPKSLPILLKKYIMEKKEKL